MTRFLSKTKDVTIPTPRDPERELTVSVTPNKVKRIVSGFTDSLNDCEWCHDFYAIRQDSAADSLLSYIEYNGDFKLTDRDGDVYVISTEQIVTAVFEAYKYCGLHNYREIKRYPNYTVTPRFSDIVVQFAVYGSVIYYNSYDERGCCA